VSGAHIMEETAETRKIVKKAGRVFGPVAVAISKETLGQSRNNDDFKEKYIARLASITGNRALVENIIKNGV